MKKKLILMSLLILALVVSLILPAVGCTGEPGLKGNQGSIGLQGEQGIQGEQGVLGEQGLRGVAGAKGAIGARGATGSAGATGEQGERGPAGVGYPGATGPRGPTGPQGPAWVFPTPTIDGTVTLFEWYGATVIDVANDMGTVSVIAYSDYLYVLFEVKDSTDARDDTTSPGLSDKFAVNINPTDGGPWGKPYDIIFQIAMDPACFGSTFSSGKLDDWGTYWSVDDTQLTELPAGLESKTTYSGNRGITEWKIPLGTISPLPSILKVGGACDIENSSYMYPIGLDWDDVTTYEDITVQ